MFIPNLHLRLPRLQPNTLPCSTEEADLCAVLSCNDISCIRQLRVNLPSATDLTSLLKDDAGAFEIDGKMGHRNIMMEVEILGFTQGATFAIGTAKIDLPAAVTGPEFSEESSRSRPFREPLVDGTGRRAGMLAGHFFSVQLGRQKFTNKVDHVHLDKGYIPTCPQKTSYVHRNSIENGYIKCHNPGEGPETLNGSNVARLSTSYAKKLDVLCALDPRCSICAKRCDNVQLSQLISFEDVQGEAANNLLDMALSMLISSNLDLTGGGGRCIEQNFKVKRDTCASVRGQLVGQDQDQDEGTSPRTSWEKVDESEPQRTCEQRSTHSHHHQQHQHDHPHINDDRRVVATSERTREEEEEEEEDCSHSPLEIVVQQQPEAKNPCIIRTAAAAKTRRVTTGFRFKPTERRVDWVRLATTDVSKIERDGDLRSLGRFLHDVTSGKVDRDGIEADPTLAKAFRIAQLQTQYVLHCHEFPIQKVTSTHEVQVLRRQTKTLRAAIASMELEAQDICRQSEVIQDQLRTFRRESKTQNKVIRDYSILLERHSLRSAVKARSCDTRNLTISEGDEDKGEGGIRQGGRERERQRPPRRRRKSQLVPELGHGVVLNQDAKFDQVNSTSSRSCSPGEEQSVRLAMHIDAGDGSRILPDHNRREGVFSINRIPETFKESAVAAQVPHELKGAFLKNDATLGYYQDGSKVIIGQQPRWNKATRGDDASFTGDVHAAERVGGGKTEGRGEVTTDQGLGIDHDVRNNRLRLSTTMKPHNLPAFPSSPRCHQESHGVSSPVDPSDLVSSAVDGWVAKRSKNQNDDVSVDAGGDFGGGRAAETAGTFGTGDQLGRANEAKLVSGEDEVPPGVYSGEHKETSLKGRARSFEREMGEERVERGSDGNKQTMAVKAPPCKSTVDAKVVTITVKPMAPVDSQPSPTKSSSLGESVGHESRAKLSGRRVVCGAAVVERGGDVASAADDAADSRKERMIRDPVASALVRVDQIRHQEPRKDESTHLMVALAQQEAGMMRDQAPLSIERVRQSKVEASSSMSSVHQSAPDPERLGLDPETVLDLSDLEVEGESEIDVGGGGGEWGNNVDSSVASL